jgi:hypothetical protein
MKKYEHRHVRMAYGFASVFSKVAFDRQLSDVLREMEVEGWELKSSIHEGFLNTHVHLIFGREVQEAR